MGDTVLQEALDYIDFLKSLGHYVSLSGFDTAFTPFLDKLRNYEIHLHGVCFYLKQNGKTEGLCIRNKNLLNKTKITEPYYSCCFAGVEEFVIPVMYEGKSILRINLSGFRGTLTKSEKFMERISLKCGEGFDRLYMELSPTPPKLDEVLKFINPLKYMFCELYKSCQDVANDAEESSPSMALYQRATRFIGEHYMHEISCESLAAEFNYSASYMQYVFKKEGNNTVKAYINEVRLDKAKYLLTHSFLSITEVAFATGFFDSNYFSTAFKKKYGASPKKFRDMFFGERKREGIVNDKNT